MSTWLDDGTVLATTGGSPGWMGRAHSFAMPVSGTHLVDDLGAHWKPAADGAYATFGPGGEIWASGQPSTLLPFAAGDHDGDGFEDLALFDVTGRFSVHPGPFVGAVDLSGSIAELSHTSWIYPPTAHGDMDGDGLDELAGAYEYGAWLLQGGETGALEVHDEGFVRRKWYPWGWPNEEMAIEVRELVDLNEDGYADLITAAPRDKTADGSEQPGFVWVEHGPLYGNEELLEDAADLTLVGGFDPTADHPASVFGEAIATADFDADGSMDLAIGAPFGEADGGVFLYLAPAAGTYGLGDADATVRGPAALRTRFGGALQAQDVDGDGAADLLVEAAWDSTAGVESGALYLYLGSSLF